MPFTRHDSPNPVEMLPGIVRRTLTAGEKMMLIEVHLDPGAVVPMHTHPHEQTGYVVSGRMRLQIAEETLDLDPGDAYMIPGGVKHEATALDEPLVIVDIFSPPREEYR
jgi:quercetin dioxygenase-like cupin family protein